MIFYSMESLRFLLINMSTNIILSYFLLKKFRIFQTKKLNTKIKPVLTQINLTFNDL